jgi:hypothetical protein
MAVTSHHKNSTTVTNEYCILFLVSIRTELEVFSFVEDCFVEKESLLH